MTEQTPAAGGLSRRAMLAASAASAAGALLIPGVARATTVAKYPFPTGRQHTVLLTGDAGTGTEAQYAVANAAKKLFAIERLSLAVGLGDNIYENGPETPDDDEFEAKFERPNAGLDVPWLMVLGNHDTSGVIPGDGSWLARGNNEVEYHARSRRWWMPSRYYSVKLPAKDPIAEFLVIDANPLCSYIPPLLGYWSVNGEYMTKQRQWLRGRLANSTARWKFVCSHHPLRSNGPHGNAGSYDGIPQLPLLEHANGTYLRQWFEQDICGRAEFLLAGHDHAQQVLHPSTATKGSQQLVTGAAAKSVGGKSTVTNRARYQDFTSLGFMTLGITSSSVTVRAYTVDVGTATAKLAYQHRLA